MGSMRDSGGGRGLPLESRLDSSLEFQDSPFQDSPFQDSPFPGFSVPGLSVPGLPRSRTPPFQDSPVNQDLGLGTSHGSMDSGGGMGPRRGF